MWIPGSYMVREFSRHLSRLRARQGTRECRVERNVGRILAMLAVRETKATFFTLGWIAERYPQLVRRIAEQGHEVASHGYGHERASDLDRTAFRADIERAKGVLENLIGSGFAFYMPAQQASINDLVGRTELPRAVALGAQHIQLGDADIVIAGGQENMSMSPHVANLRAGHKMGDMSYIDSMIRDGLWDAFNGYHMGQTAENVAQKWQISREMQDIFAVASQNKAEQS